MRLLWWIISLAIAGAILYSLVFSRAGKDGRREDLIQANNGVDDENVTTLGPDVHDTEFADEGAVAGLDNGVTSRIDDGDVSGLDDDVAPHMDSGVEPRLDNGIGPGTPFLNVDTSYAAAARGAVLADVDEEYATLPGTRSDFDENGDEHDDDDDTIIPDEDDGFIIEGNKEHLDDQTYMNTDDVIKETDQEIKKDKGTNIKTW